MCLFSNEVFPKRAKEDIICYKSIQPRENFYFTPSTWTKINKTEKSIIGYEMKSGLFEFIYTMVRIYMLRLFQRIEYVSITRGFIHTYKVSIKYDEYCHLYECIIPKGSLYYEEEEDNGCYASRSIIFRNKII